MTQTLTRLLKRRRQIIKEINQHQKEIDRLFNELAVITYMVLGNENERQSS